MKYIHSSELLTIPEGGEFPLPVEFSRGSGRIGADSTQTRRLSKWGSNRESWDCGVLMEVFCSLRYHQVSCRHRHRTPWKARQGSKAPLGLIRSQVGQHHLDRAPSWRPEERRGPPNGQNAYREPDHGCDPGLQVQDALRLRPFPHQRQHRGEPGDRHTTG